MERRLEVMECRIKIKSKRDSSDIKIALERLLRTWRTFNVISDWDLEIFEE